jgi:hypothetical protein
MSFIKNALKIFLFFIAISCGKSSLNTPSYSDNKTFKAKNYYKNEPISPFGNIVHDTNDQQKAITYYEGYIEDGMYNLSQNEEYLIWLGIKREQRLKEGKLNGFKQESIPSLNSYYIKKLQITDARKITVNERIYFDIDRQIYTAKEQLKAKQTEKENAEIESYTIKNNIKRNDGRVEVLPYEY